MSIKIQLADTGQPGGLDLGESIFACDAEEVFDGGLQLVGGVVHFGDAAGSLDMAGCGEQGQHFLLFTDGAFQFGGLEGLAFVDHGGEAAVDAVLNGQGQLGGTQGRP